MSVEGLLKLRKVTEEAQSCRSYLADSISEVVDALNRAEAYRVMRKCNEGITSIMKIEGRGSPLVESIASHEPWPVEE